MLCYAMCPHWYLPNLAAFYHLHIALLSCLLSTTHQSICTANITQYLLLFNNIKKTKGLFQH